MISIYEANVKYILLDKLVKEKIEENSLYDANVNVIIDLKEIIRKYYRNGMVEDWRIERSENNLIKELSSDIIKIIGHYRNYFFKMKKYSTFYLMYSNSKCQKMIDIESEYKAEYYDKYFDGEEYKKLNKITEKVINVVKRVSMILPHVYYIDSSTYDENIWTKYILDSFGKNMFNVLLTNDDILLQNISSNSIVLNLKGDFSKVVCEEDVLDYALKKLKTKPNFSYKLYPLVLSITGNKKYSIPGLERNGYGKAVNRLNKLVKSEELIDESHLDLNLLREQLKTEFSQSEIDTIIKNYKMLNSDYLLMSTNEHLLNAEFTKFKIKENVPKNEIHDVNDKFFTTDYHLDLEMLYRGEKL